MKALHVFTLITTPKTFFDGQFRYLSENGYDQHLISSDKEDEDFTKRNHLAYFQTEIARRIDIKADVKAIISVRRYIRVNGIECVFGHTPKGALVAMIAAWLAGCKHRVYYRHGVIYTTASGLKRFIFKSVEQITALFSTDIINVSPSLSAMAVKDRLNPVQKQYVIGAGTCGGIDTVSQFNPDMVMSSDINRIKEKYDIPQNSLVIGFCGRICRDKGIIELAKGFKLFSQNHPDCNAKLMLVGAYDERDILPDNVKRLLQNDADTIMTGHVDNSKINIYYACMDVLVFPSYREGFGMSVIEASAMKVPILVSRSHGCIDSIREHISGEYIDLTPEGICKGLEKMIKAETRSAYGERGRQFVIENFEQTIMWPKILNLYNTITNNKF